MSLAGRGRFPNHGRTTRQALTGLLGTAKPGPIPSGTTPLAEYAFDPTTDHPALVTDLAIGAAPTDNTPTWTRIHDTSQHRRLQDVTIQTGRNTETDVFGPGTANQTLDNSDRFLDPHVTDGLDFAVRIRHRAVWGSRTYELFTGFCDDFPQAVRPPSSATTTVNAPDMLSLIAGADLEPSPYAATVAHDPGLRAWWRLGDTAGAVVGESSSNHYLGTYTNSPALNGTGLITGDGNPSASFPAPSTATLPAISAPSGAQWAIEVLLSHPTATADEVLYSVIGANGTILVGTRVLPVRNSLTLQLNADGTLTFTIQYDTSAGDIVNTNTVTITTADRYDDDDPHVVQVSRDHTAISAYVDGVSVGSGTLNTDDTTAVTWTSIQIGPWSGQLQDLSFYDSPANAADHYDAFLGWPTDSTGRRMARLLDLAGIAETEREIDAGNTTMGRGRFGTNRLTYQQRIADTESGQLYVDQVNGGRLRFENRYRRILDTRSTVSQATFTDDPAATTGYRYEPDLVVRRPKSFVFNDVTVNWVGGSAQVRDDASIQANGHRSRTLDTDLPDAQEADSLARWFLAKYKDRQDRITALTLMPSADKRLFDVALGLNIGDRITIRRHPQGVGSPVTSDFIIEGKDHSISVGVNGWTTVLYVSNVDTGRYILWDGTDGWDGTAGWAW